MTRAAPGSSPLARGLRRPRYRPRYGHGIIPARAGFTRTTTSTRSTEAGSSPLARGLPVNLHLADGRVGIIPARAGFTAVAVPHRRRLRDHPRSRGVYADFVGEHNWLHGVMSQGMGDGSVSGHR